MDGCRSRQCQSTSSKEIVSLRDIDFDRFPESDNIRALDHALLNHRLSFSRPNQRIASFGVVRPWENISPERNFRLTPM